jgi:hypothetical protein
MPACLLFFSTLRVECRVFEARRVLVFERTDLVLGKHAYPSARRLAATFPFRGRDRSDPTGEPPCVAD